MSKFTTNAFATASIGGAAGASLGGSVVSGVSAVGGSLFCPVGTFLGTVVGVATSAAVGGTALPILFQPSANHRNPW